MTTRIDHGSAKIYQFPARGRFAASAEESGNGKGIAALAALGVTFAPCGSGWYHEEAIRDAEWKSRH